MLTNSNKEAFLKKSKEKFGDKFDYSLLEYSNCKIRIKLICPNHGIFTMLPETHLISKTGCIRCSVEKSHNEQRGTNESFIKKAKSKHGNKYEYSKVDYKSNESKVEIICPRHGSFLQKASNHLMGKGCPGCKLELLKKTFSFSKEEFVLAAKEKFGELFDYQEVVYDNCDVKVKIFCKKHEKWFFQTPYNHIRSNCGCHDCGRMRLAKLNRKPIDFYLNKFRNVHKDKFKYEFEEDGPYNRKLVKITCCKGHIFYQTPPHHCKIVECPKCCKSSLEVFVGNFLIKNSVLFEQGNRKAIAPLELDINIPSKNLAVECNGIYWHSELCGKNEAYHLNKLNLCKKKDIRLLQILEPEIRFSPKIVEAKLKSILGLIKRKIHARKCEVRIIDKDTKRKFINKYHLQGDTSSFINLGLFYKNRLVSVMTFCRNRISLGQEVGAGRYELARFCSVFNFNIVGGAGKLLSFFEKNYAPKHIITYADLRWSVGNLYYKLGFSLKNQSQPNYWYFNGEFKLKHRFGFRKNILKRKLKNFDPNLTEWENMQNHGWNRIWDCGCLVFEKKYE